MSIDALYRQIGRQVVLNFAAKAGTVKKAKDNCKTGFPCGYSCISKTKNCRSVLDGQAKTFADWLGSQAVKTSKTAKPKSKPVKPKATAKPEKSKGAVPPASDKDLAMRTEKWQQERGFEKGSEGLFNHDKCHTLLKDLLKTTSEEIAAPGQGKNAKGPDLIEEGIVELGIQLARGKTIEQATTAAKFLVSGLSAKHDDTHPEAYYQDLDILDKRMRTYAQQIEQHPYRDQYLDRVRQYLNIRKPE